MNSTYPSGDRGGNSEYIPSVDGVKNLHSVWDSVIYQYPGYPTMPLSNADWSWYTTTAANLSNDYPVNSSSILSEDYMGWATESYDIAKNYVYPGFTTG